MKKNKIVITGATGLIGKNITNKLFEEDFEIYVVTRNIFEAENNLQFVNNFISNDDENALSEAIDNSYGIIHLAGENLFAKRWTRKFKNKILESRLDLTDKLIALINKSKNKPKVFISASAVGYYGNTGDEIITESSEAGDNFLSEVCKGWESASDKLDNSVRRVITRIGIVLSDEGGALKKMLPPFNFFIGGPLGSGKQWVPWIHIDDLTEIFYFLLLNEKAAGKFNAVSPNPVTNSELSKSLGKVLRRPSLFKVPEVILKLVLGESASAVIEGSRVIPQKLNDLKFYFKYNEIDEALKDLLVR